MEKTDVEFWNGVSKGILICINCVERAIQEGTLPVDVGKSILEKIREEQHRVGKVHVKDLEGYLRSHSI